MPPLGPVDPARSPVISPASAIAQDRRRLAPPRDLAVRLTRQTPAASAAIHHRRQRLPNVAGLAPARPRHRHPGRIRDQVTSSVATCYRRSAGSKALSRRRAFRGNGHPAMTYLVRTSEVDNLRATAAPGILTFCRGPAARNARRNDPRDEGSARQTARSARLARANAARGC